MALLFNKKNKEDKKGKENNIGKIIYSFLLFMPLFAILTTSLYAIFNKNAYQSYANNQAQYELQAINNFNQLEIGKNYIFEFNQVGQTRGTGNKIAVSNVNFLVEYAGADYSQGITHFAVSSYDGVGYLLLYNDNYAYPSLSSNNRLGTTFSFDYEGTNPTGWANYYDNNQWFKKIYNTYTLDNSWEYGIYKTEQSNLYNWSKTTGTYTVLHNTTNLLGITNTFTPMLMAYWLLISVIYFIFDIALILIWAVHKKIHLLVESI